MYDILLINPPLVDYDKRKRPKTILNTSYYPPMGIAYLASFLKRAGFNAVTINIDAVRYGISKIPKLLKIIKPKVIGICINSDDIYPISHKIIKKIKEVIDVPLVVGGVFSTSNPEFLLKKDQVDYVARGEGENTLLELMKLLIYNDGNLAKINGLSYKVNGKIVHNPARELIKNLDDIPFPTWDKFTVNRCFVSVSYKNPAFAITASRGRHYRCAFCSLSVFQYYRFRSPKNVVDEIKHLINKFNIKDITFLDPTLNVNPKWVISLCKELIKQNLKIKWRCLCRVDKINEKMIAYMKAAGCYNIALGIETSKDEFLNFLQKDFTIEQVESAISIVKKYKIEILAYFMYGIPGQKISDLEHNFKFIKKINPDYLVLQSLFPISNSKLYNLALSKGWLSYFNLDPLDAIEKLVTNKKIWKIPNLEEKVINYYIRKTYIHYFFSFKTIIKFCMKYIKSPSRLFFTIKNIIHS